MILGLRDIGGSTRMGKIESTTLAATLATVALMAPANAQQLLTTVSSPLPCGDYGYSLDGGADFDGDGAGDLVAGLVPCSVRIIACRTGAEILKILPPDPTRLFGAKVAVVGDMNLDGAVDISVGATTNPSLPAPGVGAVYVFSGSNGTLLHSEPDLVGDWWFGRSIASAGDFDGDGDADLVIGSPHKHPIGETFVVGGGSFSKIYSVTESPQIPATSDVGRAVSRAGDLDGDGTDEFVASGGGGWIVRGSVTHNARESLVHPFMFWSLDAGIDASGDGVPDIAIGYVHESIGNPSQASWIHVLSGADFSPVGWHSEPATSFPYFGGVVRLVGDINGDGKGDLVVGSGNPSSGPFLPGLGPAAKIMRLSFPALGSVEKQVLTGPAYFGGAIAGVGDVNGNGSDEFAVRSSGSVQVFTGACGSFTQYQKGVAPCYGLGQVEPELNAYGCATAGGIVYFEVTSAPGGSIALIFFGTQQALMPMGFGCALKVWPVSPAILGPLPLMPIGATGPGVGFFTIAGKLPMPLPPVSITMQAFMPDSSVPAGFAATNGLQMTIE